jgi:ribosomal protein L37AE/L43A
MNSVPSYTVDRETAATLREWLFEHAVEKHGESEISEPLAELAAAIDGVLYEQAEAVELGAWARAGPLGHQDTSRVDGSPVDESRSNDAREPAGPDALDMGISKLDRIYDTLPDSAWRLDHEQSTTNQERSPTATPHDKTTPASNPRTRRQHHRLSVQYRTAYECSVCGGVREVETSFRVCTFVDECPNCGAVARFTAGGIPTPLRKD